MELDLGKQVCSGGRDAYFPLQLGLSVLGLAWIVLLGNRVRYLADLPDDVWRLLDEDTSTSDEDDDVEMGWNHKEEGKHE